MQRFILFLGDDYYPAGGWDDFVAFFPSAEEAKAWAEKEMGHGSKFQWYHIVDTETWEKLS